MPVCEVVGAVPGRGVHGARARFERHVVAEHAERIAARTADGGSGCVRARRPSSARPARRTAVPTACATASAQPFGDDHRAAVDRRTRRSRTPDETRSPDSTESSMASSSRSGPRRACRRAPARAPPSSPRALGRQRELDVDRRRRVILRIRLPPRRARCGSGCTSAPASCPCRRAPARRTGRRRGRSPPDTGSPSSGTARPRCRARPAAGTARSSCR